MIEYQIPPLVMKRCERVAQIHADYYKDEDNTRALSRTLYDGILSGIVGEWAASKYYGVDCLAFSRLPGEDRGADVVHNGERIDVKTTTPGNPIIIPQEQKRKLTRDTTDVFLLVWWRRGSPTVKLVGRVSRENFLQLGHQGMKRRGRHRVECYFLNPDELEPLS